MGWVGLVLVFSPPWYNPHAMSSLLVTTHSLLSSLCELTISSTPLVVLPLVMHGALTFGSRFYLEPELKNSMSLMAVLCLSWSAVCLRLQCITPHLCRSSSTWHQRPQCLTWLLSLVLACSYPSSSSFLRCSCACGCCACCRVQYASTGNAQAGPVAECVASVPEGLAPVAVVMMPAPAVYAVPMPEVEWVAPAPVVAVPVVGYLRPRRRCTQHQRPCGDRLLRLRLHLHWWRRGASARGSVRYSWDIWCLRLPSSTSHLRQQYTSTPAPWYTIYSCASGATPVIVYMTPASAVYAAPVTVVESMLLWHQYQPGQSWQWFINTIVVTGWDYTETCSGTKKKRSTPPPRRSLLADVMVPKGKR